MSLRREFTLLLSGRRKNFQLAQTKETPCYIATSLQSQNIYISWTKGTPPIEINVFFRAFPLFRTSKTTFYAYDRKNTNDDNDGCNNNYDGNFDDNDDKNYHKQTNLKSFG